MGLYDYVGDAGDQVKCFYVPCITVKYNKETKKGDVCFHCSGGRLAGANNAPYMTHYYNYGKDFAILDYLFASSTTPIVHIFKDARWVETREWNEFEDDYDYPPVTIDKNGDWTNIHSAVDMKEFVETFIREDANCTQMETDGLEAVNLSYKLSSMDHYRSIGIDAMRAEFGLRDQIRNEAYNYTLKPFYEKWADNSRESDLHIIGLVLEDYLDKQRPNRENWRDVNRYEYEWYAIFSEAISYLSEKFENPIEEYFEWAKKQGIEVDREWAIGLFDKYAQIVPERLIKEYEEYINNRGW
jgi:hypothetical protein